MPIIKPKAEMIRLYKFCFGRPAILAVAATTVLAISPALAGQASAAQFSIGGKILEEYNQAGKARGLDGPRYFGNATTAESDAANSGRFQKFANGDSIYWQPGAAAGHANQIGGSILAKWGALGFERGSLRYPVTRELAARKPGRYNRFQTGNIYYSAAGGAHPVWGEIFNKYDTLDYENGYLGFPTSDEVSVPERQTWAQKYQGGKIVWTPTYGAHTVVDPILTAIESAGGPVESSLLYHNPTSDAFIPWFGGLQQNFANAGPFTHRDTQFEFQYDLTKTAGSSGSYAAKGATLDQVRKSLEKCFTCMFPVQGAANKYPEVGDSINLKAANVADAPVRVIQSNPSLPEWTFEALDGHFDGGGSIVAFRFFEDGGRIKLQVKAGIVDGRGSIANWANEQFAGGYWQSFIDRVGLYMCYDWQKCDT